MITDSSSLAGADIHWFITGSVGQSKVLNTLMVPNNDIEDISIDNKGPSYSVGGGINYKDMSVTVNYTNLGEAGAEISGDTLNRDSFEQILHDSAPKLVDGISVEAQQVVWSNDTITAAVGLGLLVWKLDYSSQLEGGAIRANKQGVDVFYQASLAYQLAGQLNLRLKVTRYRLVFNEVNKVSLGLQYSF